MEPGGADSGWFPVPVEGSPIQRNTRMKKLLVLTSCAVVLLAAVGCSSDDDVLGGGGPGGGGGTPTEAAAETGLDGAMTNVVGPMFELLDFAIDTTGIVTHRYEGLETLPNAFDKTERDPKFVKGVATF